MGRQNDSGGHVASNLLRLAAIPFNPGRFVVEDEEREVKPFARDRARESRLWDATPNSSNQPASRTSSGILENGNADAGPAPKIAAPVASTERAPDQTERCAVKRPAIAGELLSSLAFTSLTSSTSENDSEVEASSES
jgi:hypothetical protein